VPRRFDTLPHVRPPLVIRYLPREALGVISRISGVASTSTCTIQRERRRHQRSLGAERIRAAIRKERARIRSLYETVDTPALTQTFDELKAELASNSGSWRWSDRGWLVRSQHERRERFSGSGA
jgi:hypothetical protein